MKLRRLIVLLVIVSAALALAAVVMASQGSFIRERIVRPLSYAFWIGSIMIRGTPQVLFWGILLILTLVMASRSLFGSSREPPRGLVIPSSNYRRSRLRYWSHQLLLTRYESARFQLYESIARLSMDVLSYQDGSTLQQYQRQVNPDTIQPEFLAPFFRARTQPIARRSAWNIDELRRLAERLWESLPLKKAEETPQNPDVEQVLTYLEEQMDLE